MSEPTLAPVDDYAAKDDDARSEEETVAAEDREGQVDQIADYHDTHPTLDTSGPEHDPEVQAKVKGQTSAVVALAPVVTDPQGNADDGEDDEDGDEQ